MRTIAVALICALALASSTLLADGLRPHAPGSDAVAQPKGTGKGKAAAAPAVDTKSIVEKIKSGDAAKMMEGLSAASAGGAAAAPAIEDVLRKGASLAVTKAAIEALGAIGQSSSSAVLRPLLHHRVQDVRRAAAKVLGKTKGAEAVAAFKEGLRSGDAAVRGYAASGLGNLGATDALPDLFTALDKNVTEASAAIG